MRPQYNQLLQSNILGRREYAVDLCTVLCWHVRCESEVRTLDSGFSAANHFHHRTAFVEFRYESAVRKFNADFSAASVELLEGHQTMTNFRRSKAVLDIYCTGLRATKNCISWPLSALNGYMKCPKPLRSHRAAITAVTGIRTMTFRR